MKDGISRLTWVTAVFNDRGLHKMMSESVYADHESWSSTRGRSISRWRSSFSHYSWRFRRTGGGG